MTFQHIMNMHAIIFIPRLFSVYDLECFVYIYICVCSCFYPKKYSILYIALYTYNMINLIEMSSEKSVGAGKKSVGAGRFRNLPALDK